MVAVHSGDDATIGTRIVHFQIPAVDVVRPLAGCADVSGTALQVPDPVFIGVAMFTDELAQMLPGRAFEFQGLVELVEPGVGLEGASQQQQGNG